MTIERSGCEYLNNRTLILRMHIKFSQLNLKALEVTTLRITANNQHENDCRICRNCFWQTRL